MLPPPFRRATLALPAAFLALTSPASAAPPPGQSALLNGMHDVESAAFMEGATPGCDKGWITDLRYIGAGGQPAADCHDAAVAAGISIIQRLDVDGSHSFPLDPSQAPGYASAFASFASQCPNIHVWIVGNEPNFTSNDSDPSSFASPYAEAYAKVHAAVHAVAGHGSDLVLLAPASPYSPFCICSMHQIIEQVVARGVAPDGFAVHAYTQAQHPADFGSLASLVISEDMSASNDGCGYPFHWQFRIYRDWIAAIEEEGQGGKPVFITESGNACAPEQGNPCYPDQDVGYFHAMYQEIDAWNQDGSHATKVRAVTPYRWTLNDDGTGRDFAIGDRPALDAELAGAFAAKRAWTTPASCGSQPDSCADDAACSGPSLCDLTQGTCSATWPCGADGTCPTGDVCRAATGDCAPSTRGAATIVFDPPHPDPGTEVTIDVSAATGYTNIDLAFEAVPGAPVPVGAVTIQGTGPFHWIYEATVSAAGTYRATFRADPGANTVYAIGYVNVGDVSPGDGGAGETDGAAGTGGAAGSGGPGADAGASGNGGSGAGGNSARGGATADGDGCGCALPGSSLPDGGGGAAVLAVAVLLSLLRRSVANDD